MALGEQFVAFVCKTSDGAVFGNSLTPWTCGLQGNLKLFGLGPLPTIFLNLLFLHVACFSFCAATVCQGRQTIFPQPHP